MCEIPRKDVFFDTPLFPNPMSVGKEIIETFSKQSVQILSQGSIGETFSTGFESLLKYFHFGMESILHIMVIATALTILRLVLEWIILKRIPKWFKLEKDSGRKFPEGIWNLSIYTVAWIWVAGIVIYHKKSLFFRLSSHWQNWKAGVEVEPEIYWLYMFQIGFYTHFLFASIFINVKRKDFLMIVVHHLLTISLLSWSYGVRYYYIGVLVLFLQDIGDLLLEAGKTLVYFKVMNGKKYNSMDNLANSVFAMFVCCWFLCRLYWFPMKVVYSTAVASILVCPNGHFYLPFNILLFILYCMQVYWTYFIVKLLYKVLMVGDLEDNREYDVEKKEKQKRNSKKNK